MNSEGHMMRVSCGRGRVYVCEVRAMDGGWG